MTARTSDARLSTRALLTRTLASAAVGAGLLLTGGFLFEAAPPAPWAPALSAALLGLAAACGLAAAAAWLLRLTGRRVAAVRLLDLSITAGALASAAGLVASVAAVLAAG